MKDEAILVLRADNVFPADGTAPFRGFVAIQGSDIAAVGTDDAIQPWLDQAQRVIELGDKVITPGYCDVHTFFSGWVLRSLGIDFADVHTISEGIAALQDYAKTREGKPLFGHNLNPDFPKADVEELNQAFPHTPVVIFTFDRDTCWMNEAARQAYEFTPEECYAEKIVKMMAEYLKEPEMEEKYIAYMQMLNERGVTSIKEMTFDTYYGFMDVMEKLEQEKKLTVRVDMMSQPVAEGINIPHGLAMRERFQSEFLHFSGYNRMTDRGIPSSLAELIEPYKSHPGVTCTVPVEWDLIEKETLEADRNGFRYSLHAQGDGAVRHCVELFDRCEKVDGKLKNRHAITDLEYSNPEDLKKFGKIGGITEVYSQIQSLDNKQDVLDMIDHQLGMERSVNYWNRRIMWDSGITVSCGTDLPLLIPDIPEGIFCGCGGYFKDGLSFNEGNMLKVEEMLTAWTNNGQINCGRDAYVGTLSAGKRADIAVLDQNVFTKPLKDMRDVKVCLTISDGRIVYEAE